MARREGFEPTTPRFVVLGRLNPLSIRSISQKTALDEGDMSGQRKRELPFNALAVNKAAALNGKTTEYSIEGARGLWLAVTPKGTATYVFRYDDPFGRVRSQLKKKIGARCGETCRRTTGHSLSVGYGWHHLPDAKEEQRTGE